MDCAVWLVTFLGCLFVSIDAGLGAGIALGLALLFARTAFARIGAQAPLPGAAPSYRDAELYNLQVWRFTMIRCFHFALGCPCLFASACEACTCCAGSRAC